MNIEIHYHHWCTSTGPSSPEFSERLKQLVVDAGSCFYRVTYPEMFHACHFTSSQCSKPLLSPYFNLLNLIIDNVLPDNLVQ